VSSSPQRIDQRPHQAALAPHSRDRAWLRASTVFCRTGSYGTHSRYTSNTVRAVQIASDHAMRCRCRTTSRGSTGRLEREDSPCRGAEGLLDADGDDTLCASAASKQSSIAARSQRWIIDHLMVHRIVDPRDLYTPPHTLYQRTTWL